MLMMGTEILQEMIHLLITLEQSAVEWEQLKASDFLFILNKVMLDLC